MRLHPVFPGSIEPDLLCRSWLVLLKGGLDEAFEPSVLDMHKHKVYLEDSSSKSQTRYAVVQCDLLGKRPAQVNVQCWLRHVNACEGGTHGAGTRLIWSA